MSRFIQLHILTFYPPSNLNRDDTGRPKSAIMGGVERLRVSSQAIKRAVRTSDIFARGVGQALGIDTPNFDEALGRSLGVRSKRIVGLMIDEVLKLRPDWAGDRDAVGAKVKAAIAKAKGKEETNSEDEGDEDEAPKSKTGKKDKSANKLAIGSPSTKRPLDTNEAVHLGPEEITNAKKIAQAIAEGKVVDPKQVALLVEQPKAADIAMFGRMLADNRGYNVEAAVQVAHAVTTHKAVIEDDYFTAVEDLKRPDEFADDAGAAHVSELGFGSGVFYLYVCIDKALLVNNLGGDAVLAAQGLGALTEALATVSPTGKQASFASRARASFILAEKGDQQPRTLSAAFVKPVDIGGNPGGTGNPGGGDNPEIGSDILGSSIAKLQTLRQAMDKAYGACADAHCVMDVMARKGTLSEIKAFVAEA
jgi:CRISPR system Cascade subunit CasC